MTLDFRRGDAARPRGHALAYFQTPDARILATYLVIPPIEINLAKYIPPMFAGQMPAVPQQETTAMPLPPLPEEIAGGVEALERLADLRGDDLVYCGGLDPGQLERLLMGAAEAGQRYAQLYRDYAASAPEPETPALDVEEVMLSLMGDHDRVSELAKMIGRLRYVLEGGDRTLVEETVAEMERIARHMPAKYRAAELIAAAQRPGSDGARLAELHVDRCYKLALEEYGDVARIEAEIKKIG